MATKTTSTDAADTSALLSLPKVKRNGKYILICCPFHNDSNPSCSVKAGAPFAGVFKCFSCGAKGGWDKLAKQLGLDTGVSPTPDIDTDAYAAFFESVDDMVVTTKPSPEDIKKGKKFSSDWRGFDNEFLKSLGAYEVTEKWGEKMLRFAVNVKGKEVGHVRARLKKVKGKPSYLNMKGSWSKTHGLFLYDESLALMRGLGLTTLVLVEGPRDALRLYRDRIPTVCILGTQSWSDEKRMLLETTDIHRVVLCMDGDEAGYNATKMLKDSLDLFFDVKSTDLWEYESEKALDPGNMPTSLVKVLRKLLS